MSVLQGSSLQKPVTQAAPLSEVETDLRRSCLPHWDPGNHCRNTSTVIIVSEHPSQPISEAESTLFTRCAEVLQREGSAANDERQWSCSS